MLSFIDKLLLLLAAGALVVLFSSDVQCGSLAPGSVESSNPVVTTGLGKIKGSTMESRLGKLFFGFRGIRYAAPPVGPLRFQPPVPVENWHNVFDATDDGPMCPQKTANYSDVSEDCLRLNIYTRELPTENSLLQKPVLVYLHPGGFWGASGQSKNFAGPNMLMEEDIVFVAINYRLGSLGFMSTGTKDCPGNMGLKDQVVALQFIKNHIARFGGDPNSVTVMGYSAGAISTTLHMVSPMSKGLFHKAIVMSGGGTAQWTYPRDQLDLAQKQARLLNCPDANIDEMMKCLREAKAEDYAKTTMDMFEMFGYIPVLLWKPVIEPDFGQERFLAQDPTLSFQSGRFQRVPVLGGITKDEFVNPAIDIIKNPDWAAQLEANWTQLAPICFQYERNTERSKYVSSELRKTFLNQPVTDKRALQGLSYLYADGLIGFGMYRFLRLASRFTRVHEYMFSYVGRRSHTYYPDDKTPYGAVHHDDLIYLLTGPEIAPFFNVTDPENETITRMTKLWTAFARRGDPNRDAGGQEVLKGIRWRPKTFTRDTYLEIGNELVMKENLFTERFEVWKRLFPLAPRLTLYSKSIEEYDDVVDE